MSVRSETTTTETHDVVVIGGGPAGAAAAWGCARNGWDVVVVEKAAFPREKVCGGCLSPMGVRSLETLGLGTAARQAGVSLQRFDCAAGSRRAQFQLDGTGVAIGRELLDDLILTRACAAGAERLRGIAHVQHHDNALCEVAVSGGECTRRIRAKVVIAADGLAGTCLPEGDYWRPRIVKTSWFGVGARLPARFGPDLCERHVIAMRCGVEGYFGAVRLSDGTVDFAAALSPGATKRSGGPGAAVAEIARCCRVDPAFAREAVWRGTPLLTRTRRAEGPGVFVVGDCAGYVEPFTGEGISWALAGGLAVSNYVGAALRGTYRAGAWSDALTRIVGQRRVSCRLTTIALRRSWLLQPALALLSATPSAAALFAPLVAGPWRLAGAP